MRNREYGGSTVSYTRILDCLGFSSLTSLFVQGSVVFDRDFIPDWQQWPLGDVITHFHLSMYALLTSRCNIPQSNLLEACSLCSSRAQLLTPAKESQQRPGSLSLRFSRDPRPAPSSRAASGPGAGDHSAACAGVTRLSPHSALRGLLQFPAPGPSPGLTEPAHPAALLLATATTTHF